MLFKGAPKSRRGGKKNHDAKAEKEADCSFLKYEASWTLILLWLKVLHLKSVFEKDYSFICPQTNVSNLWSVWFEIRKLNITVLLWKMESFFRRLNRFVKWISLKYFVILMMNALVFFALFYRVWIRLWSDEVMTCVNSCQIAHAVFSD